MKRNFLTLIFISCSLFAMEVTAQDLEYAFKLGASQNDIGQGITSDRDGNTYVTGYFEGSVDFDPSIDTAIINAHGKNDVFVAKFDPQGNYIWGIGLGSQDFDHARKVATDRDGNVYITGFSRGDMDMDPGPDTMLLHHDSQNDAYVAKYTTDGELVWAFFIGGEYSDVGWDIQVFDQQVYVAGEFKGKVDFNPGPDSAFLNSLGYSDMFVTVYDLEGQFVNATQIGGDQAFSYGRSVEIDRNGNVYVSGHFQGTVVFDTGGNKDTLETNGYTDVLLASFDPQLVYRWSMGIGGSDSDAILSSATDYQNNIYLTGFFSDSVDFDPSPEGTHIGISNGDEDIFVAKYSSEGLFDTLIQIGGPNGEQANDIALDDKNNVYLIGYFYGTLDFDPGPGVNNLTSNGDYDIFIAALDAQGNLSWAFNLGGNDNDQGYGLCAAQSGYLLLTGHFKNNADFDPSSSDYFISSNGSADAFFGKYLTGRGVGMEDLVTDQTTFMLYPNPIEDEGWIMVKGRQRKTAKVDLLDINGRELEMLFWGTIVSPSTKFPCKLGSYPPGLYLLRLRTDDALLFQKIIIGNS